MDPNACLKEIREYLRAYDENGLTLDEYEELFEHIRELNGWLCSGGFPPTVWLDAFTKAQRDHSDRLAIEQLLTGDPWESPATAHKGEEPF